MQGYMKKLNISIVPVIKIRIKDHSNWVVATLEKTYEDGYHGGVLHVSIYNVPTVTAYFERTGKDRPLEQFIIDANTSYLINKILPHGMESEIADYSPKRFAKTFLQRYSDEIREYRNRGHNEKERFKRLCFMHAYHILDGQEYEGMDSWGNFGIEHDDGIKDAIESIIGYPFNSYQVDEFLQNEWQWDTVSNPEYEYVAKHIELLKKGLQQHLEDSK